MVASQELGVDGDRLGLGCSAGVGRLGARLADVDAALEEGAVFDGNAGCGDVRR